MAPLDPSRTSFELRGSVTFRDASGAGLRLTQLVVDVLDAAGNVERHPSQIDATVPPSGSHTQTLVPDRVSVPAGREPTRLRIGGSGVDRDGRALTTDVVDTMVTIVDGGPGGGLGGPEVTILAAGDIGDCGSVGAASTARLLDANPGTVLTLGDHAYPEGTADAFAKCYEPFWGRHKGRTRPSPGNHDWGEANATPYFNYFGAAAGPRTGYYSFDLGAWHILSLNSNIGGSVSSPQFQWALADVTAHPSQCTMAIWHHTRFSSGPNGPTKDVQQLWWMLDNHGVDVVLAGHEHMYERFAPQDHEGVTNPQGIRLFVVGTGGGTLAGPQTVAANSQVRGATWGVLRMTLRSDGYAWTFLPVAGGTFTDAGTDVCR